MLGGRRTEPEAGAGGTGSARRVPEAALALALVAGLAAPAYASAAPATATAKLRAASAPARELKPVATIALPGGATAFRFQQRVSGIKVLNAQVVVSDPRGAPPELVVDSSNRRIEPAPSPRVGKAAAVEAALRGARVARLRAPPSAGLAIEPGGGGTLVWRVLIPAARPLGDFEVLLDALSGAVVSVRDLLQHARRGHAQLYDPNPVAQSRRSAGVRKDHHDKNTARLTALRRPVTLRNIRKRQRCLRGKWVHAKLGSDARKVCKRGLEWWGVKRSQDRFEALMTYYHIDRSQRYIQSLGFGRGGGPGINKRQQLAVADAFRDDNSYFSPLTRKIRYGSGGVDDAEDADVIVHEYAHAIQDDQVRGFGYSYQAGAIGEGFGDYWAAVMSSRSRGTGNKDDVCIFEWDGVSWGRFVPAFNRKCGRRADRDETRAQAEAGCPSDIHCLGEFWSSSLWDLRDLVGGRTFDRILLSSQFMYATDEHFDEAVVALIAADQALTGGANRGLICGEMEVERGIDVGDCP